MIGCGSTDTRTGKPCKRPAGWGVAHTSAGPCKTHGKRATGDKHPPATIHHAPPYVIEDGVGYQLPVALPYAVTKEGAPAVAKFLQAASQRSTMRFQFDPPYRGRSDAPVWMPSDDPLEEWAHETRMAVLTEAHAAYHRNPIAKAAVRVTRQFAVGRGHQVSYKNKDVEAVIEAFRSNPENAIHEYDKTFVEDLQIDGELFIRKVPGGPDESVIVPLRPWDVTEIATAPGFLRRAESYHLQETQRIALTTLDMPDPVDEWIPADEMLHIAINRHSYELRGRSDLFVILPWLRAYKEWLENRARQNKYRNTLVWDVSIDAGGTAVADAKARYSTPPTDGSVVVHHAKETVTPMTNPVGAGDAAEDGRQIKLMSSVGVQLPEYMLSDGENSNLASATAQELPALFKFIDTQEIMSEQVWTPIYKWEIEQAIEAGNLEAEVEVQDSDGDPVLDGNGQKEMISATDAFSVEYADLNIDDPKTLAEALQIATLNDWISNQGAGDKVATLMGLDPNIERKRIAQEQEQMRDEVAQGLRNPNPGDPVNDDDADEDADGNTPPAATE